MSCYIQTVVAIDELADLANRLENLVKSETEQCEGHVIEKMNEEINKKVGEHKLYYEACRPSMKGIAQNYTDHINAMNAQKITLYYGVDRKSTRLNSSH